MRLLKHCLYGVHEGQIWQSLWQLPYHSYKLANQSFCFVRENVLGPDTLAVEEHSVELRPPLFRCERMGAQTSTQNWKIG